MLCLCITGFNADPDEVTKLLELAPTSVARLGQPTQSGSPSISNGWWLESHPEPLTDGGPHHEALNKLVDAIRNLEANFASLRERLKPKQVTIYGGLHTIADQQCGVWLEPEQMRVLAACGVGWGLDVW